MSLPLGSKFSPEQYQNLEQILFPIREFLATKPLHVKHWVACSGGLDSVLLLWAMATLAPQKIHAIHVNHGLQSNALDWSQHVADLCADWQLPCLVQSVSVSKHEGNIEARARAARYRVFATQLKPCDVIWLAHHLNDQIETFFLRLMRGSGVSGLAGMPRQRAVGQGELFRPWLEIPRATLAELAHSLNLKWIEDPANDDLAFDRNYIRHNVLPNLTQRWPQALQRFVVTQQHLSSAAHELQSTHNAQLEQMVETDGSLKLELWLRCGGVPQQLSLLRQWWCNFGQAMPSQQQLQQVRKQVALSRQDAQGEVVLGDCSVRRFKQRLYRVKNLPQLPAELSFTGDLESGLRVSHPGLGQVSLSPCVGEGIRLTHIHERPVIRFRQGGEVMRPKGRGHQRDCKRLLQEYELAPWWRDRVPLLYIGDTWVALAGFCVDERWAARSGEKGLRLCWQPSLNENFQY